MATTDPYTLGAEARTKQRDQAASELVRALLIINGGGSAALLAFLQAIWSNSILNDRNASLAMAGTTIIALVLLGVGAASAATFHYFRHEASWCHQKGDSKGWKKFELLYRGAAIVSLVMFPTAIAVLAVGAWRVLSQLV